MSSSFYEDASLVMIPSGYKTSKVYSAKPTDGAGDLSFTRSNDTATRVNSAGLIEKVRTNLLTYSNTFSNAAWLTSSASVTSGQSGYDGTLNAWLLTSSFSSGFIYQNNTIDGINTFSIYCKAGTNTQIILYSQHATQGKYFDLSSGTVGANFVAAPMSASIENVGGGWYRCSIVVTASTNAAWRIYNVAVGTTYIQNAQAEKGDVATDYIPTTTAAVSVGPVANVPRLDYLNSSCPRLLLEPQRTNLAQYSEQFNNAAWDNAGGAVVSANTAVAPDGTTSADTATFAVASKILRQFQTGLSASASYTFTAYVKKSATSGANNVRLSINDTGSWVGAGSTKIALTNSWQRISLTWTASTSAYLMIGALDQNGTADTSCYGNVDVWGAQFEAGAYATSYIPTLGAAVTRGADAASKTGISSLIGQTEGTFFVDAEVTNFAEAAQSFITISDGTITNRVELRKGSPNTIILEGSAATGSFPNITLSSVAVGRYKIAVAYKTGSTALFINGTQIGSTSANAFAFTSLTNAIIGANFSGSTRFLNDRISQALLFKTRLENDDLAALTAL